MANKDDEDIQKDLDKQYEDDLKERRHSLNDEEADIYYPDKNEPRLPRDYDNPAHPTKNPRDPSLQKDHPQTDDDVDQHEAYDVGDADATGINDFDEGHQPHKK